MAAVGMGVGFITVFTKALARKDGSWAWLGVAVAFTQLLSERRNDTMLATSSSDMCTKLGITMRKRPSGPMPVRSSVTTCASVQLPMPWVLSLVILAE